MAKYKCRNPKCSNKEYQKQPGYCPECGGKLIKKSSNAIVYGILGVGVIFLLIVAFGVYAVMTGVPVNDTNISKNQDQDQEKTTTKKESNPVFENQYIKFEYPKGWTVKDNPKNGNLHVDITSSTIKNGAFYIYPLAVFESNYPGEEATLDNFGSILQSEETNQAGLDKINVAGTKGLQYTPLSEDKIGIAEYFLYLKHGNDFYILNIPTTDFDKDSEGIDLIVKTLKFK